uniref:Uncharacterized protein n=1 Tax=Helianthus annuus TaxID=4232 RepID=A0A251RTZ7_HELAN
MGDFRREFISFSIHQTKNNIDAGSGNFRVGYMDPLYSSFLSFTLFFLQNPNEASFFLLLETMDSKTI